MTKKIGYIYSLSSSEYPKDIRYIGKTTQSLQDRYLNHIREKGNSEKTKWVNEEIDKGNIIYIKILEKVSLEELDSRETYNICLYMEKGYDLVNSDGVFRMKAKELSHKIKKTTKITAILFVFFFFFGILGDFYILFNSKTFNAYTLFIFSYIVTNLFTLVFINLLTLRRRYDTYLRRINKNNAKQ